MTRLVILRILDSYFRHRWLNLLPLVLMLGLGGASFYLAEPKYTSRGRLYVQKSSLLPSLTQIQPDGFSFTSPTQVAVSELHELLLTDAFPRSIIQKTDLEATMAGGPDAIQKTLDDFRKAISIQLVGDNVIEISAQSKNPQLAQQLAIATIDSYSLWKLNGDKQESVVAQSFFRDVLPGYQSDLQKAREQLKTYLEGHPVPLRGERQPQELLEISQYQSAVDVATKRVEDALDKEESARLSQAQAVSSVQQNYSLIDAPKLPLKPETSLKERVTGPAIIAAIGFLLTIVCIIGGVLLDRSFRFVFDVRNSLDLPVLALVPDVSRIALLPVVNESVRILNPHREHQDPVPATVVTVAQLTHKQRRTRQKLSLTAQTANTHTDLADATSAQQD